MKNKFNLAILKQKDKNDFIEFNLAVDLKKEIIGQRDKLINDIIYQDPNELVLMKCEYNKVVKKDFKELLFDMSKCDIAVANAVENLKKLNQIKFDEQSNLFNKQLQTNDKLHQIKFDEQIDKIKKQDLLIQSQNSKMLEQNSKMLKQDLELKIQNSKLQELENKIELLLKK